MSRNATEFQGSSPSLPLPGDHVLNSGAVVYPGAFDQHGCPLVIFPVDAHGKLSEITKEEVVDFINYFLCLHNKKQEKESLIALVADLRQASPTTTRFIVDTLRLLELHSRTVHTVYIVQPKKKDVLKLLLKLLMPSKGHVAPFKRVLLKEAFELSNYIDRSQLTASLGGYLVYCHQSWVTFIKEIDAFVQEFLLVVQRLPSCISTLQSLSRQLVPSTFDELTEFCSTNEATFQRLRRELGLDELLRRCECVVEKLRYPENDPCYQAMAGTALFTHTAFDMLQNYSRITAAVEKIELLWQQAFSKAHVQLRVFQLSQQAQQITQQMTSLQEEKLQPYRIEIAKDSRKAEMLTSAFETSIYTPAMALVRCAEDVIHTLVESLPPGDARGCEQWVQDLDRLKENLLSSVELPHQTLGAVSDFYHYHNKSSSWYNIVLRENFLQDLLWGVSTDSLQALHHPQGVNAGVPAWRQSVCQFLAKNPSPDMAELVQLEHLANVIPDDSLQRVGKQLSQRCMTLRKLLTAPGTVPINDLQLALQWQYEFLRTNNTHGFQTDPALDRRPEDLQNRQGGSSTLPGKPNPKLDQQAKEALHSHGSFSNLTKWTPGKMPAHQPPLGGVSPASAVPGVVVSATGKPPSLSSFDSGFDGGHLEGGGGREGWDGLSRLTSTRDSFRPVSRQPQIHEENISSVSDSEDRGEEFDLGSVGNTSRASIQIIPKVTVDSLNFEIKVKRSATLPQNPWLSLPTEDLEKSYTVTITQNPPAQQNPLAQQRDSKSPDSKSPDSLERSHHSDQSSRSRDQPTQTEMPEGRAEPDAKVQESFDDPGLSPIRMLLSSTITDARERSQCSTEGVPTLLWDSYDFHNQDTCESSVRDWDLKEQDGLREVEEILGRAAGILEEEENVLAQEEMLAVLMKTQTPSKQWPLWNSPDQLSVMSSRDLVEAGVLGLEDGLAVEATESSSESASFEVTRGPMDSDDCLTEAGGVSSGCRGGVASGCRGGLLKELRELHVLDELIMEENVKIHKLKRHEEERLDEKPAASMGPRRTSKERQTFQLELQREKKEVEKLEMSLDNGRTTRCKLRKQLSRTRKVVKCSVMERTSKLEYLEDSALCEELISGRKRPCNTQLLIKMPPNANASNTDAVSFSESVTKQPVLQDSVSPLDSPGIHTNFSIDDSLGHVAVSSLQQPLLASRQTTPDSREEVGIQPQGYDDGKLDSRSRETVESRKPEDSSKPEPKLDYGAFDPGGSSDNPPVPKPRRTQPPVHDASTEPVHLMDHGPEPPETQTLDTPPMPKERKTKPPAPCDIHILNPDVNEHTNNNNNNKPITDQQLLISPAPHKPSSHVPQDDPVISTLTQVSSQGLQIQTDPHVSQYSEIEGVEFSLKVSEPPPVVFPDPCEPVRVSRADIPDGFQRCGTGTGSLSRSLQQPAIHIGTSEMMNYKTPIVLDTGSGLMKAGFADQDLPSTIFPTIIGLPKYEEIMNGNFERETYIGLEAQHMRGVLTLKYPMKNGIIGNWDDMEKIWHHTFQQLGVEPDDHPVLLTEAAMNPRDNRQRMVELMFESFNVPLTYVAMQAVLALYAAGRTTGVVFDSGDGVSYSVPVFEGYCLPHAVQRFTMAGYDVTMHLKKLLQEQGVCMRTSAELEIVREMKEKCCCVAQDYESELTCGGSASSEMHYTMPDGQVISLSTERFRAPEILFKPELIGRDHYGMHESIFKSILSSDLDLRRSFLGNIVLAGGNTLLAGLPERLQKEIRVMVPSDLGECVRVTSPKDRDFSVWSGGAVLANLPSFASAWISQEEYEEFGPQIVFRKCF